MTSIFQRALGEDFNKLHPRLQRRLAMSSADHLAQVGSGVMDEVERSRLVAVPVTLLGAARRLQIPATARDVRFELANYAYQDTYGRETIAFSRRFDLPDGVQKFDDTMIYSEGRSSIVNYLGSHQDIAADIRCEVTAHGGIRMIGGSQRLFLGPLRVALPSRVAATADVIETWDDDKAAFSISVTIASAVGALFSYRGSFTMEEIPLSAQRIPGRVRPDRERRQD
ncbi:MAG: hypothetical protein JWN95_1475 [Frankiales bacterium]|nr:hypothetical protein [Frankiales bacterium]